MNTGQPQAQSTPGISSGNHTPWNLPNQTRQSFTNYSGNCRVFDYNAHIPWDHPGNLISLETEGIVFRINGGILIPLLFLLGTPANVLNMMVFYRQGLKERINVCLFLLALVDILNLTPNFLFHVDQVFSPFTNQERFGTLYRFMMNNNLLGLAGFSYGSMLLVVIISAERCICVLFPLAAQRCIPTKAFTGVVVLTVLTISLVRFVVTAQYRVACFYEVRTQRTSWQAVVNEYYFKNQNMLRILDGIFYGFCITVGCPALVFITTIITAVRLRQIVRWRSHSASGMSSPKEIGITRMLIGLSVEFLLLSVPFLTLRVTRLFPSALNPGYHLNLFRLLVTCADLSSYISSSVNFLVYYLTGTKYRETLHALLGIRKGGQKTVVQGKQTAATDAHLPRNG